MNSLEEAMADIEEEVQKIVIESPVTLKLRGGFHRATADAKSVVQSELLCYVAGDRVITEILAASMVADNNKFAHYIRQPSGVAAFLSTTPETVFDPKTWDNLIRPSAYRFPKELINANVLTEETATILAEDNRVAAELRIVQIEQDIWQWNGTRTKGEITYYILDPETRKVIDTVETTLIFVRPDRAVDESDHKLFNRLSNTHGRTFGYTDKIKFRNFHLLPFHTFDDLYSGDKNRITAAVAATIALYPGKFDNAVRVNTTHVATIYGKIITLEQLASAPRPRVHVTETMIKTVLAALPVESSSDITMEEVAEEIAKIEDGQGHQSTQQADVMDMAEAA